MGKNVTGGKHAKRAGYIGPRKLRLLESEEERYAIVIKMLGNSQCHVKCADNITRLCIIRKKFTGKHKGNNFLKPGSWVLVGTRGWESKSDRMETCDLMEVYTESDKPKLMDTNVNFVVLLKEDNLINNTTDEIGDIMISDQYEDNDVNLDEI
jgi:translation initiation factor IF-1